MTGPKPSRAGGSVVWLGRLLAGVIVIVLVLLLVYWRTLESTGSAGQAELAAVVAEIEASDPRWRWDQIEADRPVVPDEENSFRILTPLGAELEKARRDRPGARNNEVNFPADLEPNRLLGEGDLERLGDLLDERDDQVARAVSLKDHPRGRYAVQLRPDMLSTLLPHVQPTREVAWLLSVEAERRLHDGRAHAAADTVHATLNAGAALRGEEFLISTLVRLAIRSVALQMVERLLGMSEPGDDTLARLLDRLADEAKEDLVLDGLRGERAGMNVLFENLRNGTVPLAATLDGFPFDRGEPGWWARLRTIPLSYNLPGDQARYLRWMNRAVAIARQPPEKQQALWDAFDQDQKTELAPIQNQEPGWLSRLLVPVARKVGEVGLRDRAHLACARVALAAERFRRANQRWPASLAELVPLYLPAVPPDPFSGKALVYFKAEDGVIVYSVGRNGIDDGGVRVAPRHDQEPGSDHGLRLWDPTHRRLPPEEVNP